MSREKQVLAREIESLEKVLNGEANSRPRAASKSLIAEIDELELLVDGLADGLDEDVEVDADIDIAESFCGESFMDDDEDFDDDFDDDDDDDDDEIEDDGIDLDDDEIDEEILLASLTTPGVEDKITQDYLDDVLEVEKNPQTVVTDPSMLEVAESSYVAALKNASKRLDRVSSYVESHGKLKLAYKLDQLADSIDKRIEAEEVK